MELANLFSITINDKRYQYQCEIFKKYGLPQPVKYEGLRYEPSKELACLYSHISVLMMANCLNMDYYICFEDDAYPRKDVVEKMEYYITNRPKDCGVLVLGENGHFGKLIENGDYFIVRERPFGAHAYMVFRNAYKELLYSFEKQRIADIALRGDNFMSCKPYWVKDYLFIQKNIDDQCMSTNLIKRGKYFYPNKNKNNVLGIFNELPDNVNWE